MRKIVFVSLTVLSTLICFSSKAQDKTNSVLKHIVTVTFDTNASPKEIEEVDASFKSLSSLTFVKGYEWGIAPVTDRNKELKHTYAFSFDSLNDLDRYAKSPEHQKHMAVGVSIIKKVEAVQYFVKE